MNNRSSQLSARRLARLLAAGAALILPILGHADKARADWPMARHDGHRTGMAQGKSDIAHPKIRWSSYLGGSIRADGLIGYDLDGDNKAEIIHSTGGAVAAKRADGSLIWRTRTYGVAILAGVADLDGDGQDELVVSTTHNVYVLDIHTGEVRWAQPDGEMGSIAPYIRLVPRVGGKFVDLVIPECGGCGGSKEKQSGFLYSFNAGFQSPGRIPLPMQVGVTSVLTVAIGPNKSPILLINDDDKANNPPSSTKVNVLDGTIATPLLPTGLDLGENTALVTCAPGDVDGQPGEEFVCLASPGQGGDKLIALKWDGAQLTKLWTHVAQPGESFHNVLTNPLVDLDGNGVLESAVSISNADGTFATRILSAATGAPIAAYAGLRYVGHAPLGPAGTRRVLANSGTEMGVLSFTGSALSLLFSIPDQRPVLEPDRARTRVGAAAMLKVVSVDLTGDGTHELITWKLTGKTVISAYSIEGGMPALLASLGFPEDVGPTNLWVLPPVDRSVSQLALAQTDGVLHMLDTALQPTETAIPFGGYYAAGDWGQLGQTGVVASLDGGPAEQIVFTDSKGALRRIDAQKADADHPPVTRWEVKAASRPIVVPGLNGGAPTIAAVSRLPPPSTDNTVRSIRPDDGATIWEVPIPQNPINDLVVARRAVGDAPELVFQTIDPDAPTLLRTRAISSKDGTSLWAFSEKPGNCGVQPAGFSVADWNGDGHDDIVQQATVTRVNSGADGSPLVEGTVGGCYFLPAIVDPDHDGKDNVILQGGFESINMLTHELNQQVFANTDGDRPYPYGALAECPNGEVWVEGSWQFPARLKITSLSPPAAGNAQSFFLAGGKQYPDQAAVLAAKAGQGQLTAVSVHPNLAGDGAPVAVLGSGDGWLYGVDPCAGSLRFALDFGYLVGEPIFGDTDGDGLDEILVSVADGNLYALVDDPAQGTGGSGTTSTTGGGASDWPGLYGRADCYCQAPMNTPEGALPVGLLALGGAIGALRRRRTKI
ncbi:MAG: VCBS repeat-containing protein [Byssovorax sp.]